MNINSANNFRHRRLPSSDRFLDIFSPTKPSTVAAAAITDELSESEIFWTVTESTRESPSQPARRKLGFRLPEKSGILVALAEDGSRPRAIPKPHASSNRVGSELTQSAPSQRFQNSAPMKVPPAARNSRRFSEIDESYEDENDDEEMLPPHEIVAMKLKTTSSVLEGVGRTLKGRDLRQVRDAVWRQSGFID
ncbi:uncharacterized protein LOC141609180 [Silene latifolia]|uniref:uncharacterized protein LOC141609180 n=1 Tax=Silene latifolia TaxID=37657 RepID=UPI003D783CB5